MAPNRLAFLILLVRKEALVASNKARLFEAAKGCRIVAFGKAIDGNVAGPQFARDS